MRLVILLALCLGGCQMGMPYSYSDTYMVLKPDGYYRMKTVAEIKAMNK